MFLNIVSDNELLISQIVKSILILVLAVGFTYNFYRLIKATTVKRKSFLTLILLALASILFLVIKQFRLEAAILNHPKYTEGVTVGFCNVFARGQGIEFEYMINGIKYRCCNTFYPIPKDSIIVPGGRYKVRYSDNYKGEGRMIFKEE